MLQASVVPGTTALIRRTARTLHGGQGNKGWETAVLTGQVMPLWAFTHTSLKRGCWSLPLALLGHLWVCAGAVEGLASEGRCPCPHHQLPTEPVTQTTQGHPLPGSPRDHGKLPAPEPLQRLAWFWRKRKGWGGKATSAFCSHPLR